MNFFDKLLGFTKEATTFDTEVSIKESEKDFLVKFVLLIFVLFVIYKKMQ